MFDLIVVIPCYNEPELLRTVQSLFDCERSNFFAGVVVLVNSWEISPQSAVEQNRRTFGDLQQFAQENNNEHFTLIPLLVENLKGRQTGAGLPRKLGMDEAVRLFGANKSGIIASLDADCTVESNYLAEIYRNFSGQKLNSATIRFHHPVEHLPASDRLRQAAECYEKYLNFYRSSLEYCGYPYPYFTVGSAFAVTAETYRKVGGMGRQQSGEDFYFLQKVFPLGRTAFIGTTCVYPAARLSDRVPFGTGTSLQKMLGEDKITKKTYSFEAFKTLKTFFSRIDSFYGRKNQDIEAVISDLPNYLLDFLSADGFLGKITEINANTASIANFRKRFFNYFNAFKILKYLNFVHPAYLDLEDIERF